MPELPNPCPRRPASSTRLVDADALILGIKRAFPEVRGPADKLLAQCQGDPARLFISRTISIQPISGEAFLPGCPKVLWEAPMAGGWRGVFMEFQPLAWIAVWIGHGELPVKPFFSRKALESLASLDVWRLYLSEEERRVVEQPRNGACMITGAAGTGKTVVAVHRLRQLVTSEDWKPHDKALLVTFSVTLAEDLLQLVSKMVPAPRMKSSVEVCALEEWLSRFLKSCGLPFRFIYPGDAPWEKAWSEARRLIPEIRTSHGMLPESFYRSEFQQLVLPEGVRTEAQYLKASRNGRAIPLSAPQRRVIWPLFDAMRQALARCGGGAIPSSDGYLMAEELLRSGRSKKSYRAIVVDEGQDFGNDAYRLLRALTPDIAVPGLGRHTHRPIPQGDLFITADNSQRIYSRGQDLARCGINVRSRRTFRLTTNYRTTAEIRSAALVIQEASKSKLLVSRKTRSLYEDESCVSLRRGPLPRLYRAASFEDEAAWIAESIRHLTAEDPSLQLSEIVVATLSRAKRDLYAETLEKAGIPALILAPESKEYKGGVCLSTLHRLKGLEFKVVFIAGADCGQMPSASAIRSGCCLEEQDALRKMQQNLFYVASTRARDLLFISCEQAPGEYMLQLQDYLSALDGESA